MPDSGDCAEAQDHLLVQVENGHEKKQGPQKVCPKVLTCLGVGAKGTGIVVPGHHDEAGTDDGQQGLHLEGQAGTCSRVPTCDSAGSALDVPDVGLVERGDIAHRLIVRAGWCEVNSHDGFLFSVSVEHLVRLPAYTRGRAHAGRRRTASTISVGDEQPPRAVAKALRRARSISRRGEDTATPTSVRRRFRVR